MKYILIKSIIALFLWHGSNFAIANTVQTSISSQTSDKNSESNIKNSKHVQSEVNTALNPQINLLSNTNLNGTSSFSSFKCPVYSASATSNATHGTVSCNFDDFIPEGIPSGTVIMISDCSSTCHGDQYIRLFNGGIEVLRNDDGKCNNHSLTTNLHTYMSIYRYL